MFTKHFPLELEIYESNKQHQKMNTIKTDTNKHNHKLLLQATPQCNWNQ